MQQSLQSENMYKRGKEGTANGAEIMEEEVDRISSLPDELIHHILSFTDIKYAVQTSVLSSRWKLVWTTLPHLNFSSYRFGNLLVYSKFVTHVLSHRNNQSQVSSVILTTRGALSQVFIRRILTYALSHSLQHLDIDSVPERKRQFPPCFFSSQTLKYLSLRTSCCEFCAIPTVPWNMPALRELHLTEISFFDGTVKCLDLFSKCVNLRNLTLQDCSMAKGMEAFSISAPQLYDLKLIDCLYGDSVSFNIIAPKLASLSVTAHRYSYKFVISAPQLSSIYFRGGSQIHVSTDGFHSLEKVNMYMWFGINPKEEDARYLVDLFQNFGTAKFLTLYPDIIECLSSFPELVANQPSPFRNLEFLKIEKQMEKRKVPILTLPNHVRSYFLENTPTATCVMHLPEEPPKKPRKQVKARTRKNELNMQAMELEEERVKMKVQIELQLEQVEGLRAKLEAGIEQSKAKFEAMHSKVSSSMDVSAIQQLLENRASFEAESSSRMADIVALKTKIEGQLKDFSTPFKLKHG